MILHLAYLKSAQHNLVYLSQVSLLTAPNSSIVYRHSASILHLYTRVYTQKINVCAFALVILRIEMKIILPEIVVAITEVSPGKSKAVIQETHDQPHEGLDCSL